LNISEVLNEITKILNNGYVTNVICGIITVIIIYYFQLNENKRKIKKDFRCGEIIDELFIAIRQIDELKEKRELLQRKINQTIEKERKNDGELSFEDECNIKTKAYQSFFIENKYIFNFTMMALTYHNNNILLDSVSTVFFINTNFKLLKIVNNIKNRIPNVKEEYSKIEKFTNEDWHSIYNMTGDLFLLADYYKELYEYLDYDLLYMEARLNTVNNCSGNNIIDLIDGPEEERKKFNKEFNKKVKQEYRRLKKQNK
jgi:hypothetical protein